MTDLVKLYNPANAAALTPEQLADLQKLTSPEIKELAQAYPNRTMLRAYLLIIDNTKPPEKQLPQLSTFENLWNLREKNAFKNHVAYAFKGTYKFKSVVPVRQHRTEVLDLSETDLMNLPGFKTANKVEPPQQVNVTRINKVVNEPIPVKSRNDKFIVDNPFPEEKSKTKKPATKKTKK